MGYKEFERSSLQEKLGKILSWIGPLKERVELSVMGLNGEERGKLLDVGCGNGQFLAEMRDLGWEVFGVEPDRDAVKIARECFGLCVHEGLLEENTFPDNTFQAITMNHVIEHLVDPIRTLKECNRMLKSDGKLIIRTPNIKSFGLWKFGQAWLHLDPPRHLYLFSPLTLKRFVEGAGLKVFELRTSARYANWMWVNSYLIQREGTMQGGFPKNQSLWLRLNGLAFQIWEHVLCLRKDLGEEVVLLATKKEVC
jgi:SAM-dependent methyltransferase